jgi:hypothetical protein
VSKQAKDGDPANHHWLLTEVLREEWGFEDQGRLGLVAPSPKPSSPTTPDESRLAVCLVHAYRLRGVPARHRRPIT